MTTLLITEIYHDIEDINIKVDTLNSNDKIIKDSFVQLYKKVNTLHKLDVSNDILFDIQRKIDMILEKCYVRNRMATDDCTDEKYPLFN